MHFFSHYELKKKSCPLQIFFKIKSQKGNKSSEYIWWLEFSYWNFTKLPVFDVKREQKDFHGEIFSWALFFSKTWIISPEQMLKKWIVLVLCHRNSISKCLRILSHPVHWHDLCSRWIWLFHLIHFHLQVAVYWLCFHLKIILVKSCFKFCNS